MKEGSFCWIWVFAFREAPREAAQETQMPFMRGAGACPSALSRAPGLGVHRSAAQTLGGEHDSVRESRLTVGKLRGGELDFDRSRIGERGEHLRNGLPYMAQALGKELGVSVPQLDVIACRRTGFEPD